MQVDDTSVGEADRDAGKRQENPRRSVNSHVVDCFEVQWYGERSYRKVDTAPRRPGGNIESKGRRQAKNTRGGISWRSRNGQVAPALVLFPTYLALEKVHPQPISADLHHHSFLLPRSSSLPVGEVSRCVSRGVRGVAARLDTKIISFL